LVRALPPPVVQHLGLTLPKFLLADPAHILPKAAPNSTTTQNTHAARASPFSLLASLFFLNVEA
jgi:hypothetical protein